MGSDGWAAVESLTSSSTLSNEMDHVQAQRQRRHSGSLHSGGLQGLRVEHHGRELDLVHVHIDFALTSAKG